MGSGAWRHAEDNHGCEIYIRGSVITTLSPQQWTSGTLKVTYVKNLILAKPIIHAEWGSTQHQYEPEKEKK
ncbi:hypothetical protein ACN38_g3870 [Penicillium nordicum]|uniref:Uncharacterized protein n=1 Tax=Penicillium nordicum TaxID=229535 RepID=A0A0M9WHM6_9EURO|nr:hypothetical protein ACN38_g3870 [Penicillium nordicum]